VAGFKNVWWKESALNPSKQSKDKDLAGRHRGDLFSFKGY